MDISLMAKLKFIESKESRPKPNIHPSTMHIYTDGSYRPEGNAACAFLIFSEKNKHVITMERYAHRGKTINQMELQAINKALDHPNMEYAIIYSDSAYSIACLTLWRKGWARNNWMTPLGVPVKNKELIQEIGKKIDAKKSVRFEKVKAHSGDPHNSTVDYLATTLTAMMRDNPSLPDGPYPC
jgi:ribonuclease HI